MLPGNHESEEKLKEECKSFKNIIYLHKDYYEKDDCIFLAYGSGGFAERDLRFNDIEKKWSKIIKPNQKIIFLTHAPPYNTPIDVVGKRHVGSKTYREFIEKYQPALAASGHLHENFSKVGKIGKTQIINPGPDGRLFIV